MRRVLRGALFAALVVMTAYDVGVYVRGDFLSEEPGRDIAVGLGALAAVAVAGWASAEPNREGAGQ